MKDVIIIGAGPGGYETALRAAKQGLSVLLIEKDKRTYRKAASPPRRITSRLRS